MNFFYNLKMVYKILTLVVIAAIGMALIGYRGYSTISESRDSLEVIYQKNMQQLYCIGEIKYMLRDMQSRGALSLSAKDQKRIDDLRNDQKEIRENFESNWKLYEQATSGTEAEKANAAILEKWKAFGAAIDQVIALAEANNKDEGATYLSKNAGDATKQLRLLLEEQQKQAQESAQARFEKMEADAASASRMMVLFCVAALIALFAISMLIIKAITGPLDRMVETCRRMGDGDFRITPRTITTTDEIGELADTVCIMRENLNKLMRQASSSAEQIAAAGEELTASAQQSAQASTQVAQSVTDAAGAVQIQQGAIESSTQAVSHINESVTAIDHQSNDVASRAESAAHSAAQGLKSIEETIQQIRNGAVGVQDSSEIVDRLGESSQQIGTIVETISGIAAQTNLLALNAAIEAARAGEHGRGFAVVAEEVRKLAEQSGEAAQKITQLITGIQQETQQAVTSMQKGRATVDAGAESVANLRHNFIEIESLVNEVTQEVKQMSQVVHSATADTENITSQVANIDKQGKAVSGEMQTVSAATEEQSASASEIATASESLSRLAEDLQHSLHKFKF